ncbi:MAG: hypothetical protein ACR2PK_14455, partial [Acidimicrobiales bacterium]
REARIRAHFTLAERCVDTNATRPEAESAAYQERGTSDVAEKVSRATGGPKGRSCDCGRQLAERPEVRRAEAVIVENS